MLPATSPLALASFLFALAACGGRSQLAAWSGPHEDEDDTPLPPGVAPPVDHCAAPLPVPRGRAWLGDYDVSVTGAVTKFDCADDSIPVRSFVVPRFFLDPDEVTNACYAHCVTEGECLPPLQDPEAPDWQSPDFAEFPAAVDRARAEAFCCWRRGRLASVAELGGPTKATNTAGRRSG